LFGLAPVAAIAFFCWALFRPPDPAGALEAAQEFDAQLIQGLDGIEESDVEAYAIEKQSGVIRVGFLLTKVQTERTSSGITTFEASLFNLAQSPVKDAYVTLRLIDEVGRPIETVDLIGEQEVLDPGRGQLVTGEHGKGEAQPRILEETIYLESDEPTYFTVYSYNKPKYSPGLLSQLANLVPLLEYKAVWSQPDLDWNTFEVEFHYDRVLED
jgi:hypothetical protein